MANKKVSQLTSKPSVLVTDLFPIADPSTGQLYKTTISDLGTAIGSGVSSVNGLVGAVVLDTDDIQELVSPTNKWFTDTRAREALSASSPLAYNSGTGVFSIPVATSSQNGYLTSADWTTFNAKQAALSGTGFVKISGTTISYDNSTYALDSAVVKLTGNQTVAGVKTFTSGIVADVTTGGTQGFASTNSSASGSSIFLQNNSTSVGNAIGINNTSTADGIAIGNETSGRGIYISNATTSGSGKGISIDNYNGGIGIEVGSDSTADAIKILHLSGRAFNIQSSGGGYGVIINNTTASTSAPFTIQKQGANRITFTDAGAGTFVSTISAAGATLTGALSGTSATFSGAVELGGTQLVRWGLDDGSANARTWGIRNGYNASGDFVILSSSTNNTTLNTVQLQIARSGAATFSSSVTANTNVTISSTGNASLVAATNSTGGYSFIDLINNGASGRNYQIGIAGNTAAAGYANNLYIDLVGVGNVMTLTSGRNVGIGTTAPTAKLHAVNVGNGFVMRYAGGTSSEITGGIFASTASGFASIGTQSAHSFNIFTSDFDRFSVTSGGQIFMYNLSSGAGTNTAKYSTSTGQLTYDTSSARYKDNIRDSVYGLSDVLKMRSAMFEYKEDNRTDVGLIAEELQLIIPELVGIDKSGRPDSVSYDRLVSVLIKSVQELKAELDTLKNK